jgi:Zn2+/Cd2+-exporting ATPase
MSRGQFVILTGAMIAAALVSRFFNLILMSSLLLITATILAGIPVVKKAIQSALLKIISIELLVTIAVIGALIIGEFLESAAVTFLFLLGSYLESRTLEKTRSSIKSLLDLAPLEARVLKGGKKVLIPAAEVNENERIFIQSGEKVPADGRVVKGEAFLNESMITGEPTPVEKLSGEKVYSGSIIDNGYIEMIAEKVGEDTTFAKILQLVEEAQDSKARTQKFIERFASFYTPSILALSILVYLLTRDIRLSLTFLVISCPGALVISAPVSIVAGIGNGAKRGILIKGGEIIEKAAKLDAIAFDKTGTLTVGRPQVAGIKSINISDSELLMNAAIAEAYSEHHLAKAIIEEAKRQDLYQNKVPEKFTVQKGMGIETTIQKSRWLIGNRKMMIANDVKIDNEMEQYLQAEEEKGRTTVMIANDQGIKGVISITDLIRPSAADTIKKLEQSGKRVVMLTGDNERTAAAIAAQIGIKNYYAGLLPEQKVNKIKELQSSGIKVGMVGDGINDAPAIAAADVGIAMGGAGTQAAMETADIILMSDMIDKLPLTLDLARATFNNMKQNMFFAVLIVSVLLIGVLTKTVFLASGMFIHELSVLLVIVNAIRLLKYKTTKRPSSKRLKAEPTNFIGGELKGEL